MRWLSSCNILAAKHKRHFGQRRNQRYQVIRNDDLKYEASKYTEAQASDERFKIDRPFKTKLAPFPLAFGLSFSKLPPMTCRTAHSCQTGRAAISLHLRAENVRLPELQGPACGRFMR
jgi:hypothetical protein